MTAHRLPADLGIARDFQRFADPGTGAAIPASGVYGHFALKVGSGTETNTLADPDHPGQRVVLTAYSVGGGTRTVTAATKVNVTGNTHIDFTAVDQVTVLEAVPYSGNTNKCRWEIVVNDGPTLT